MASSRPDRATVLAETLARLATAVVAVLRRVGHGLRRGTARLGRAALARRVALGAMALRAMWWSALGLLVVGGPLVLGHEALPERWRVLTPFVVGLVVCGLLRLLAPARHLRVAALVLGALHGAAVVLVWTAFAG